MVRGGGGVTPTVRPRPFLQRILVKYFLGEVNGFSPSRILVLCIIHVLYYSTHLTNGNKINSYMYSLYRQKMIFKNRQFLQPPVNRGGKLMAGRYEIQLLCVVFHKRCFAFARPGHRTR